jgi:hypothetical protein
MLLKAAEVLADNNEDSRAVDCWAVAYDLSCRSEKGPNHSDSLAILEQLSDAAVTNHPARAVEGYRALYGARTRLLGSDHPQTLSIANRLGSVLEADIDNAESMEEALMLYESVWGCRVKDDLSALKSSASLLGRHLKRMAKIERRGEVWRELMDIWPDHQPPVRLRKLFDVSEVRFLTCVSTY